MLLMLRALALLTCLLLIVWTLIFPLATLMAFAFIIPLALLAREFAKVQEQRRPQPRRNAAHSSIAAYTIARSSRRTG